jgi:gluconolactonase
MIGTLDGYHGYAPRMRRVFATCVVVAACGGGGGGDTVDARRDDGQSHDPDAGYDPLAGAGAVELVDDGYEFTEGPQWRDATGDLVFSDIPANTIYTYTPGGGPPTVLDDDSGNSNGLAIDGNGDLLAAEHGTRSVTRTTVSATIPLAERHQEMRLNSPNDVIESAGTIYFTDPPYGIQPADRELPFNGVFRIDAGGLLYAEHMGALAERPNGIGIDPAGGHVYVADTADGNLYDFPVGANGALGSRTVLAPTSGNPDGLAIDAGGNLFVATSTGVEVFGGDGTRWGVIPVPQQPANCAFGDADHRTLYITARTAVYSVRLANPGLPRN